MTFSMQAACRRLQIVLVFALITCGATGSAAGAQPKPLYKDASASVDARVEDLLSRMTPEEKLVQITTVWSKRDALFDANGKFNLATAKKLFPDGIGHVTRPSDRFPIIDAFSTVQRDERETVERVNAIQRYAINNTRLGIPAIFHEEGLHGYAARNATHFPQAIGLASTWDPALIERVFTVAAREIRARGSQLVLAPVVDVARDPRWGRFEETYGEDPYLASELGVAAVWGFQGRTMPLARDRVFATLKHMTGHGQPEGGTNTAPANISQRILRDVFFPPFIAAIQRGNAQVVMPSYNEIDGLPSHVNRWLLQDVLRGEMGFKGTVASDYTAINDLVDIHKIEPDYVHAAARALKAGVDVDMPDGQMYANLPQALSQGLIAQTDIDRAVRNLLRLKFMAGLFEHPYADVKLAQSITGNAEARALALEAAHKSVVLLKNDGLLPLRAESLKTLAVIGPNAARIDLGGYSNVPKQVVTILDGIKAKLGTRVRIDYAEGVRITDRGNWYMDESKLANPAENRQRIKEAVQVAKDADTIVLVIGGSSAVFREGWSRTHLGDRATLNLIGEQQELVDAMFALRKPVVVVLINGQPLAIPDVVAKTNAMIEGWYLGQEGGTAMADILFGDANPGGKMPATVPRSVGQLPMYYNEKPSSHRGYHFASKDPLFPFGFGLSYTTFEISEPQLSSSRISAKDSVTITVTVKNTGSRKGDEVVQLYVRDVVSSVTRPVKELKGFRRVTLEPGASSTVKFTLSKSAFAFWNEQMQYVVEPGEFQIMAGPDSQALKSATLVVEP
jgi:beta-glucosidase